MVWGTRVLLARRLPRKIKRKIVQERQWDHPLYGSDKTPPEGRMRGLMKGLYPITRTKEYLKQGIVFRDSVRIMTINYGSYENKKDFHEGIINVINLNVPQLRYTNPDVQIELLENLTPTPFITFYLDGGDKFHIDVDGKKQFDILIHLQKVIGKPKELLEKETADVAINPANFGEGYERKCMCMVEGQVPCSSVMLDAPGNHRALCGKNINTNPKKYAFGKEE